MLYKQIVIKKILIIIFLTFSKFSIKNQIVPFIRFPSGRPFLWDARMFILMEKYRKFLKTQNSSQEQLVI